MIVTNEEDTEYNQLERDSYQLSNEIARLEAMGEKAYDLKRQRLDVKRRMIDILDDTRKLKAMKTAQQLRDEVVSRPIPARYETGIYWFDQKLKGGFEAGTFIQLSGISGGGKTTLAMRILSNVAKGNRSVLFNFEMGDRRIIDRLDKLLETNEQWQNLLIDSTTRKIDELCNEIRIQAKSGVKFFLVDSMMKIETKTQNIVESQIEISSKLSKLAQEEEIIIILINQQSEDALKNNRLSLKGSNSQTYDADMIFYITIKDDKRILTCTKNRQDEYLFDLELELSDVKNSQVEVVHSNITEQVIEHVSMPTV